MHVSGAPRRDAVYLKAREVCYDSPLRRGHIVFDLRSTSANSSVRARSHRRTLPAESDPSPSRPREFGERPRTESAAGVLESSQEEHWLQARGGCLDRCGVECWQDDDVDRPGIALDWTARSRLITSDQGPLLLFEIADVARVLQARRRGSRYCTLSIGQSRRSPSATTARPLHQAAPQILVNRSRCAERQTAAR